MLPGLEIISKDCLEREIKETHIPERDDHLSGRPRAAGGANEHQKTDSGEPIKEARTKQAPCANHRAVISVGESIKALYSTVAPLGMAMLSSRPQCENAQCIITSS